MKLSAGILMYRGEAQALELLLVHPGGPFWAKKDRGAWSIPKGEYEEGEEPLAVAKREFVIKDVKLFFRDTTQWSQLILLAVLLVIYLFNIRALPLFTGEQVPFFFVTLVSFLNLGLAGFVLASIAARFIFPAVSLEGRQMWLLRSSPLDLRALLWSKYWTGTLPLLVLALIITVFTNILLRATGFMMVVGIGTILLLTIAIAALAILAIAAALLVRHSLASEDAFIPRRVIHARAFQRVTILGAVGQSAFLGTIVLVPIGAAAAHGLTGLPLALVILPLAGTAAIVSLRNDRVQARIGRRATTTSALALLAGGAASVALLGAAASPVVMAFALLPIGAGFGLLGPPLMSELTEAFPPVDQPIAVGSFNLGFFLGGSLGASLATALVQSGATIPGFADRPLPGFTTAELLLAVGPAFAAVAIAVRDRRQRRRLEAPSIA